jgi:hypothetical protein
MSHFHVRMVKRKESASSVEYDAESFDFHPEHQWEAVGVVFIDKEKRQYTFSPGRVWQEQKILPPEFYQLPEDERKRRYSSEWEPKGYASGAYSTRVNTYSMQFIEKSEYPDTYPPVFFVNEKAKL